MAALVYGCPACSYRLSHATFTNSHNDGCCPKCNTELTLVEDENYVSENEISGGVSISADGETVHLYPRKIYRFE